MIGHVSLHVNDFQKSKEFYTKMLAPLGYVMVMEFAEWSVAGFGEPAKPDFWIKADGADKSGHVAFTASSKQQVDGFYEAGIAAGGKDNGKPDYRKEYSPGYYAAFVIDPDGHNIEVVYFDPNPPSA